MHSSKNVIELFFDNVHRSPQLVALELNDQLWTYGELLANIGRVVHYLDIEPGEIVFQYVDRSLEMICGLLSIMCAGGVYCPLNVVDSPARISLLLEDLPGRFVLVHQRTFKKFVSINSRPLQCIDLDYIFSVEITDVIDKMICLHERSPGYILSTSGTTGRQKAIVHTHGSLAAMAQALFSCGIQHSDKVLQLAASSWIIHIYEILVPLLAVSPGTIVLLQPGDNWNMPVLCKIIEEKQITVSFISVATLTALLDHLELYNHESKTTFVQLKVLCPLGEPPLTPYLIKLKSIAPQTRIVVVYGSSEQGASLAYCIDQEIDELSNLTIVPLGHPLLGYRYLLVSHVDGTVISASNSDQIGQIYIAGAGLFHCYYNNPQLTSKVHPTIDDIKFFKTGDLARYNVRGELVFVGRIDFQIKIRGQRIEPGEIESILKKIVDNCLVTKVTHEGDDFLVAYVQTTKSECDLRQYCLSRLPLYMVPSIFVVLNEFSRNENGKIDRKALPPPNFSLLSASNGKYTQPETDIETQIHKLWCQVLPHVSVISTSKSLFELCGTSITLMKLSYLYQTMFKRNISIIDLFRQPTITDHARLLQQAATSNNTTCVWSPLNLTEGRASYAQENVWIAEQTRFIQQTPPICPYNTTSIYRIDSGYLSIKQCLEAIDRIVARHWLLRTRLIFNVERGYLQQSIIAISPNSRRPYSVAVTTVQSEEEFKILGYQETLIPIDVGVFRCHFVRYSHFAPDVLKPGDYIMFTFHHGSIDAAAVSLFFNELELAYSDAYELSEPFLQYIDYADYERSQMDMSAAKDYWRQILRGYSWHRQLDLPYDFGKPLSVRRSGRCWFLVTWMPLEIVEAMITRAAQLNATLFHLALTCFYIFLAQLSPHNQDACVAISIRNRYRPELENIIGMFVNMLPCRMTFDTSSSSTLTFNDLMYQVQHQLVNMVKYGNLPYLELLDLHRVPSHNLQVPFLQTFFALDASTDYDSLEEHHLNLIPLSSESEGCSLSQYPQINDPGDEDFFVTPNMYDTDVTIHANVAKKEMALVWTYSTDLFTYNTIDMLSKRFIRLLSDLLVETSSQQLGIVPLVKLVPMANNPINLWIDHQQEQLDSTTKILTSLEEHIQAVFSRVLGTEQIDIKRSFFEQGGTSLKAVQAIYFFQQNPMTVMVDANLFFADPSVIGISEAIEARH